MCYYALKAKWGKNAMIKKKKVVQFRDLYSVISKLLESYTYEDVAVILKRDHDFEIPANTLKHYVYKHKKSLKEKSDSKPSEPEEDTINENKSLETESSVEEVNNVEDNDDEFEAAIERAKMKVNNKSILNRR